MATNKDTVFYAANYTNKYLITDRRTGPAYTVKIPFELTVAAPHAVNDTYNLLTIPANWRVMDISAVVTVAFPATTTISIGDSGDADRYVVTGTVLIAVNAHAGVSNIVIATGVGGALVYTGVGYTPTVDTVVFATLETATPSTGKLVGWMELLPAY